MTLLNEANKIYLGNQIVDAIYAGATKVWPTGEQVFDPVSLGGLVAWLDASQLALTDGAAVTTWPNLSAGNATTVVGTPAMTFKTNILNSMPVVRFKVNEGRIRSVWAGGIYDYELIYITRWVGPSTGRMFSVNYPPSNFLVGTHSAGRDLAYDNGTWIYGPSTGWDWQQPGPWRMYGGNSKATFGFKFLINGVLIGTTGGVGGFTGGWGISGYSATGAEETMDMDVAELLIYDRQLADDDRVRVEDYLRTKWGLP